MQDMMKIATHKHAPHKDTVAKETPILDIYFYLRAV